MNRLITIVFVGVILPGCAAEKSKSQEFTSAEGKFTVSFPAVPTEERKGDTSKGESEVFVFAVKHAGQGQMYRVTYSDYPEKLLKEKGADKTLESLSGGKGSETIKEQKITLGQQNFPGRECLIKTGSAYIRQRIFLVGNRIYIASVVGPGEFVTGKEATQFLDSFKVND